MTTVRTAPEATGAVSVPEATAPRRRRRPPQRNTVAYIFLAVMVVYFLVPLWFLIVASTKNASGLFNGAAGAMWFDDEFAFFQNIGGLLTYSDGIYFRWIANSALYAFVGGLGATVLAVFAGYGFAKFRFRGRDFAFSVLLGSVMVPLTALVIPTFVLFSELGITDTIWAVILPSLLSPFGVYLMRVYAAEAVPDDLLDAARVDGAGEFRTFFQVALPLLRPAVITVLLLSVVGTWNNYFLPLAMLSNSQLYPITVGIGLWQGLAASNNGGTQSLWVLIIIGSLISVIPLVAAFLTLQKYWQGGLAIGSLK